MEKHGNNSSKTLKWQALDLVQFHFEKKKLLSIIDQFLQKFLVFELNFDRLCTFNFLNYKEVIVMSLNIQIENTNKSCDLDICF